MSLLLDALKKAAHEKQQASSSGDGTEKNPGGDELELTLDDGVAVEQGAVQLEAEELTIEPAPELDKASATTSTVSDEALQLLVYKTNKQYRHTQKIIWGGALAAALFALILGGVYYYYGMVDEIEALERKHKIAMRLFESQSIDKVKKIPIIENNKVQPEQQIVINKNTTKTTTVSPKIRKAPASNRSTEVMSIQRTEKSDPVNVLLNKAWVAYGDMEYAIAEDAYSQVLAREPRNRDALLGKAAIAVKQGNYAQARVEYKMLLRLDPRDQIAVGALSNLDEMTADTLGETRLKFMLQQQPDAAHLHFALGNYYAKQTRWPEAQGEYFSAWQSSSENADYAFNLAVSLDQLGKYNEARRFYEKSLNLSIGNNINFSVDAVKERLNKIAAR